MSERNSNWHELDALLNELLDLAPDLRPARLADIARKHPEKADSLQRMLNTLDAPDSLVRLAKSLSEVGATDALTPGDTVGNWQIIRSIGVGGMAEVYEAERKIGEVKQHAALKLMSMGIVGANAKTGFSREAAILAQLEDPRLSRLIDAGTHSDGRPWLAMEFIQGIAIDQGCDQLAKTLRERVALVIEIAWAVDHAHRQLIVHRDLKPANILLDQAGRPRILDFGIAKLLEPGVQDNGLTSTTWRAYTLHHASPEQLAGESSGVSTDVYQLGLFIYILLTGTRAFFGQDDNSHQLLTAMRHGPILPSRRAGQAKKETAACRGTSVRGLQRQIRGDLDSIVVKCLAFDPKDRYRGASDLAMDLQRWLDGDPVLVRSGTFGYTTLRSLRKHWVAVGAGVMVCLAFAIYLGMVMIQRDRLQDERDRTQNVLDAMTTILSAADPYRTASDTITVRELVQRTADELMVKTKVDPRVQVLLMERIAGISASDRDHEREERLLQRAIELTEEHDLDRHLRARLLLNMAIAQASLNRLDLATESLNRAWPDFNEKDYFRARLHEAQIQRAQGDQAGGADRLLTLLEELPDGEDYRSVRANAHNALGLSMRAMGRHEDAIGHFRQALAHAPDRTPEDADLVAIVRGNAATALAVQQRYLEADEEFREVIAWRAQILGNDHPSVAITTTTWIPLLLRTLRFESAWNELSAFEQAVLDQLTDSRRQILQFNLARAGLYTNRHRESLDLLLDAASHSEESIDTVSATDIFTYNVLAWTLFEIGAQDEAVSLAQWLQRKDDAADQARWPMILLLSPASPINAEQRSELRERLMSDHCAATELQALELAVADPESPALYSMTLAPDCDGTRAARMRQLGLQWQPDWDGQFDPEPHQSPLISRIQQGQFNQPLTLSPEHTARLNSLLEHLQSLK